MLKYWEYQEAQYLKHLMIDLEPQTFEKLAGLIPIAKCPRKEDGSLKVALQPLQNKLKAMTDAKTAERSYVVVEHRAEVSA